MDYQDIEIKKTEHENKFLLIYNGNYAFVGCIIADVVNDLKANRTIDDILNTLQLKYSNKITKKDLLKVINVDITNLINKEKATTKVKKILRVVNVGENVLKVLSPLIRKKFVILLIFLGLINFYFYLN